MGMFTGDAFDQGSLNTFLGATMPKIEKEIQDTAFDANVYIRFAKKLGMVRVGQIGDGGMWAIRVNKNTTVQARSLSTAIDILEPDLHEFAYQDYGEYSGAIGLDHVRLAKNGGAQQVIPILKEQKKTLSDSMNYKFNYDLMNGSGTYPALLGLSGIIKTTVSSGTVHGVNFATNTWFRNQQRGATCSTTDGFGVICLYDIDVLMKAANKGPGEQGKFKIAMMDDSVHSSLGYYLPDLANSQRIMLNGNANGPGDTVKYPDTTFYLRDALALWDHNCPSDSIRFIDPNYVKIDILRDCNFVTAKTHAENSFARAYLVGLAARQVNLNPKRSAVLNAFSS